MRKVLIVEDEAMIAEYFKVIIESYGYDVCGIAPSADEAIDLAQENQPEIVFMDVRLKGEKDGIDAAIEINRRMPVPTVYVTGSREDETMERIRKDHPAEILIKPILSEQIKDVLTRFCPQQ